MENATNPISTYITSLDTFRERTCVILYCISLKYHHPIVSTNYSLGTLLSTRDEAGNVEIIYVTSRSFTVMLCYDNVTTSYRSLLTLLLS